MVPAGATVIEAGGQYLIPGIIPVVPAGP